MNSDCGRLDNASSGTTACDVPFICYLSYFSFVSHYSVNNL